MTRVPSPRTSTRLAPWWSSSGARPELADTTHYHRRPPPAELAGRERRVGHVEYLHARFPSGYVPPVDAPGAARFREETGNRVVHAWVLAHDEPAPWLVCVHGAGMGDPLADVFAFRAGAFHRAGFDARSRSAPPRPARIRTPRGRLPSDDPTRNFHGAAQAVSDIRSVLAAIERRGEPAMLLGISLGGYVAAAVAALEPGVRGIVVGVPVVDLAELLRRHTPARFAAHPRFDDLHEISRTLGRYTCPLDLPVPRASTRRIWAGRGDRLVRPDQVGAARRALGRRRAALVHGRSRRVPRAPERAALYAPRPSSTPGSA